MEKHVLTVMRLQDYRSDGVLYYCSGVIPLHDPPPPPPQVRNDSEKLRKGSRSYNDLIVRNFEPVSSGGVMPDDGPSAPINGDEAGVGPSHPKPSFQDVGFIGRPVTRSSKNPKGKQRNP
ncbi:hypothetical protein L1987_78565 [Smallanthus sonchifolius]|uniref:Uncharacterized protein n=1 Tax=Smallanthus sonchifolius TaxID=185202 RepID=A0ACB8ZE33_9ASTR|nr:hypothetical protein L1987_78565 [Smallanthus sonchifolius]